MTGWRIHAILWEAVQNVTVAKWRLLVLGIGIGGMLSAVTWAELTSLSQVQAQAAMFAQRGGYVAVADGMLGVNAERCEALGAHPEVLSAGGMRNGGTISAANAPGISFQRLEATSGILPVWDPAWKADPQQGYAVGVAAAMELGLRSGSSAALSDGSVGQIRVINPAARNEFAARAFIDIIPPTGQVEQCWIELEPDAMEAALPSIIVWLAADEVEVRRATSRGEFSLSPIELFERRPQRWAWIVVAAVGLAIIALLSLLRRSETAVYRAFGLTRVGLVVMQQAETGLLLTSFYLVATVWTTLAYAVLVEVPSLDQFFMATRTSGLGSMLVIASAPLIATLAASGSPAALIKER